MIRVGKEKLGPRESIVHQDSFTPYLQTQATYFLGSGPGPGVKSRDEGRPVQTVSQRPMMDILGNCISGNTSLMGLGKAVMQKDGFLSELPFLLSVEKPPKHPVA